MWGLWVAVALGCETGPACFVAAEALVASDPGAAVQRYDQACELDHARACWKAANLRVHGTLVPPDPDRSVELKTRAHELAEADCARDEAACTTLGLAWYWGIGVDKDAVEADRLLQLSCDLGDGEACHWAAVLSRQCIPAFLNRYPFNEYCSEADNDDGVLALLQRSCELLDAEGCVALALHSEGRLHDVVGAGAALGTACGLGHTEACVRLGRYELTSGAAEHGRSRLAALCREPDTGHVRIGACAAGAAHSPTGLELLTEGCGSDGGCWHDLARVLRVGAYGLARPDPELAGRAGARACELGVAVACP